MGRIAGARSRRSDSDTRGLSRGFVSGLLATAALVFVGGAGTPASGAGTPSAVTFGKTSVGTGSDPMSPDRKRVTHFTLGEAGTVTKLSAYLEPTGTAGTQAVEALIYADSSGAPGALLATSGEVIFHGTDAAGWRDFSLASGLSLQPGTYWLGLISGASSHVAAFRYDSVSGSRDYNANAYASGPSNPFGSFSVDGEQMSIYATYTPAAPSPPPASTSPPVLSGLAQAGQTLSTSNGTWSGSPTTFAYQWSRCDTSGVNCLPIGGATGQSYPVGTLDVGSRLLATVTAANGTGTTSAMTTPSAVVLAAPTATTLGKTSIGASADSFAADRKRVNAYTLSQPGTVSKLSIYLTPGGASGQQVLRGLIYADSGGAPGSLLSTSSELTFTSGQAAGWYDLPLPTPLAAPAGRYWIGVITGAASNVAGFRYDTVSGSRDYNANSYSLGPSTTFGSFSADGEQMSVYATLATSSDTVAPSQPAALTASAAGANQINLSWTPSSDNTGVTGYTVRRNGAVVASSTAPSFSDAGLSPSTSYTYTVDAFDAAGNHSAQSAPASATTGPATGVQHYEYVFPANAIDVYDMDNGMRLVKTISLPATATDIRGAVADPASHTLYVSYGGDGGSNGNGSMLAYDLVGDRVLWTKGYAEGVDSMAITPDGRTIYMPTGEASPGATWNTVDAATGNVTGSISGGSGPHNTIVSLNGKHVYMGGRNSSFLTVADTSTNTVLRQIGPLLSGTVRPFTINGKETLAFTTATGFLGFQVSDINSGKVLYTVPISGPFPYTSGQAGPSTPSHGISLSPDEKELWVMDQPNGYVHVFDVSGLPATAPVQVANIKLTQPMTGSQVGCTYDCLREGWLQHSLDGRFVWVGDSGDVISTSTRTSVANLTPLDNSRVYLEIDWSNGLPTATSSRSGVGRVGP
jgi:hypothetical protein